MRPHAATTTVFLGLLPLALAACGGSPAGEARESVPPAPAADAASPPGQPGPTAATARIVEVKGTPGDTMKVVVVFENPTSGPCAVPIYTLHWPGGSKTIEVIDFVIPPGESRQRSVKTHPDDGDITTLQAETARIELPPRCGAAR